MQFLPPAFPHLACSQFNYFFVLFLIYIFLSTNHKSLLSSSPCLQNKWKSTRFSLFLSRSRIECHTNSPALHSSFSRTVWCSEVLNMVKLVTSAASLPSFQESCCTDNFLNNALYEPACILSPIFFTFHLQHLIFCKWHWLLIEHIFSSTIFAMSLL